MAPCIFSRLRLYVHTFFWENGLSCLAAYFDVTGQSSLANMNPWCGQGPPILMSCESAFKVKHFPEEQLVAKEPVNSRDTEAPVHNDHCENQKVTEE